MGIKFERQDYRNNEIWTMYNDLKREGKNNIVQKIAVKYDLNVSRIWQILARFRKEEKNKIDKQNQSIDND